MSGLILFAVLNRQDVPACQASGTLPRRLVGNHDYVGLRESPEGALERAGQVFKDPITKAGYVIMKVTFSVEGVCHYTVTTSAEHKFASMALRKTCKDGVDWKVLHFNGNLPLANGLICTEVPEIE